MSEEKRPPGVVEHANHEHHQYSEPVVRLIDSDSVVVGECFQNWTVNDLNGDSSQTCRDVGQAEPEHLPVEWCRKMNREFLPDDHEKSDRGDAGRDETGDEDRFGLHVKDDEEDHGQNDGDHDTQDPHSGKHARTILHPEVRERDDHHRVEEEDSRRIAHILGVLNTEEVRKQWRRDIEGKRKKKRSCGKRNERNTDCLLLVPFLQRGHEPHVRGVHAVAIDHPCECDIGIRVRDDAIFSSREVVRVKGYKEEIKKAANNRAEPVDGRFFSKLKDAIEHGGRTEERRALALPALVHQHDGDVVFHLVDVSARLAGQRLLSLFVLKISLALRAAKDLEEFRFKHVTPERCSWLPEAFAGTWPEPLSAFRFLREENYGPCDPRRSAPSLLRRRCG